MGCPTPLDCKGLKFGELICNILDDIIALVFQAFLAEKHGFLENKETDRKREGYSQGAGPQQGSPLPGIRSLFIHKKENILQ